MLLNNIEIKVDCFNLKYTLECGQCFRWEKVEDEPNTFIGVIHDRVLKVKQDGDTLYISSNKEENLEDVVRKYFDLDKDYRSIEKIISKFDKNVEKAVKNTSGIRHLKQDFFETLLSFIISSNNNIPRISKSIKTISSKYGTKSIESSCNIFSISISSSNFNLFKLLFISKTEVGSINRVEPAFETSCTNPFIWDLYSSLTGITKRLFLIVITFSIIYFEYLEECIISFNLFLISCSKFLFLFLIEESSFDELSSIVFSSIIQDKTLSEIDLLVYSISKYVESIG